MIDENLRKKIQKLFTMAERGVGNEAEVALKKVRQLMREHGITQDDVSLFVERIPYAKRKERWITHLHELCATFCGTVSLVNCNGFIFAGDEIGVNVARELFNYLKNEIDRKTNKAGVTGRKGKNDFRLGITFGLNEKMQECGGWRDMLIKQREIKEKHFSKNKTRSFSKHYVYADFLNAGKEAAKEINLSRQAGYSGGGLLTGGEA
jgi:hypothetical protein